MGKWRAAAVAAAWLLPLAASAHTNTKAQLWIDISAAGDVNVQLDLEEKDILELFDVDMSSPKEATLLLSSVQEMLPPALRVEGDGTDCGLRVTDAAPRGTRSVRVRLEGRCPTLPGETTVQYGVSGMTSLDVLGLVTLTAPDGVRHVDILSRERNQWTVVTRVPSTMSTIVSFLGEGIAHIGTGWDHLAFLLGLLLSCASLRRVLAMVTAFTVAHSVTLALGAFDVVRLPAEVVEPIIAASIVAVAVMVVVQQRRGKLSHPGADPALDPRSFWLVVAVAFLFGLIHGLGFAGFLAESLQAQGSVWAPLLGFNLGVEAGQMMVVAVLFPVLFGLGRSAVKGPAMLGLGLALATLGSYWTIDRLWGG